MSEATAVHILQQLSSEDTRQTLLDARTAVRTLQSQFLLESGEIQLKMAQKEPTDAATRARLNTCLTLLECFLISIECALSKNLFLRVLLDPTADSLEVQRQSHLQSRLENILVLQYEHIQQIYQREADLFTSVPYRYFDKGQPLAPFLYMSITPTATTQPAPGLESAPQ